MKEKLIEVAEYANAMSNVTQGVVRESYNYLGHYALIAAANCPIGGMADTLRLERSAKIVA